MADGKDKSKEKRIDSEDILREVQNLLRSPFQTELSKILVCSPDRESIRAFANKYPDRWAQAVAIMSRLSGYSDKLELTGSLSVEAKTRTMSDMELDEEIKRREKELNEKDV